MIQALLHIASRLASEEQRPAVLPTDDGRLQTVRQSFVPRRAAVLEPPAGAFPSPGTFCGLRLLPGNALGDAELRGLHLRLARELIEEPPYDLRWMKHHALRVG